MRATLILAALLVGVGAVHVCASWAQQRFQCRDGLPCLCGQESGASDLAYSPDGQSIGYVHVTCVNTRTASRTFYVVPKDRGLDAMAAGR